MPSATPTHSRLASWREIWRFYLQVMRPKLEKKESTSLVVRRLASVLPEQSMPTVTLS